MPRRCKLCRGEGHYYSTCRTVDTIHLELKNSFCQFVANNAILTLEEATLVPCIWPPKYNITIFKALAKKNGLRTNLAKNQYFALFEKLYFTLALQELNFLAILAYLSEPFHIEFRPEVIAGNDCPICLEPAGTPVCLGCGHHFCMDCMKQYLRSIDTEPKCAMCRATVTVMIGDYSAWETTMNQ